MGALTPEMKELLAAAQSVRRFWQATCDAHPDRKQSWEDHRAFYDLADAIKSVEEAQ